MYDNANSTSGEIDAKQLSSCIIVWVVGVLDDEEVVGIVDDDCKNWWSNPND